MTSDDYRALIDGGILDKIELIDGQVLMGKYELVFSPEQTAAAARLGVRVRCCVDAVLEDRAARADVAARLAASS